MGNVQSILQKKLQDLFGLFKKKEANIAILGLDSSGKTTLVNLFRGEREVVHTNPTLGFDVGYVKIFKTEVRVWDVGGQKDFISYWKEYVNGIHGLVFVVDVGDEERFKTSYKSFEDLSAFLRDGLFVLLLINKIDLFKGNEEALEERINTIKKYFNAEERHGTESYMCVNGKRFRSRVHAVSILGDQEMVAETGSSWSSTATSVLPGFKWLMESIEAANSTDVL